MAQDDVLLREWNHWMPEIRELVLSVLRTGWGKVIVNAQDGKIEWIERSQTFKESAYGKG